MSIQEQVQETLDELVASGAELGIQVVANRDGVKVFDAVAGLTAPDGSPVTAGTVFYNFLRRQGAMSTLVHQEVDHGALSLRHPRGGVWPAHGKDRVTVRHVSHRSRAGSVGGTHRPPRPRDPPTPSGNSH
jgi:CubicO group peptidase (beta-lactamase class C family)